MKLERILILALCAAAAHAAEPSHEHPAGADTGPTASDQSNAPAEVETTRKIRAALLDDDTLSVAAHNVKIITLNGEVTLRGGVDSAAERARVNEIATREAGGMRIRDELEVATH